MAIIPATTKDSGPQHILGNVRKIIILERVANGSYSGNRLHAENESILSQIARVGEGIFLPQLAKESL